jgi:hypothetical protein
VIKKFLKRFERLEHTTKGRVCESYLRASKRFECLEIGNKKIKVEISDKITPQETAPAKVDYFFLCPYCGAENSPLAEKCYYCSAGLKTKFAEDYQTKVKGLKRCPACQAVNQADRANCWVCGIDFTLAGDLKAVKESENVIVLNIDDKIYKSTDKNLPPEIFALMGRIRKQGYSSKVIEAWLNERNTQAQQASFDIASRLESIRRSLSWRIVGLIVFLIFIVFQFGSCFFRVFR